ncbi:alpha beta hydrolase, putative [Perkinsus marinus ATCC 50983]|uniref:Alpha beta hydrolase, putative n=1 Tax=Perkinsus marinus (strain ATCC 50983 / TXsc) TaxID=423536 RepID=C5KGT1_PERM5|nr:alpha beta hydrolase, putative [Perkinsus marinus ATCC 50983]EER16349.1 alpha beta hydrolase, putative [Perkinsus marinus ATCC 50983]|eukprot:XP_002784553.1 alpha beta hydrolase, putative [Perkinsus marinus ATCC 50983]
MLMLMLCYAFCGVLEEAYVLYLGNIRSVGVYLHGFPDSGVRPVRCSQGLRRKAEDSFVCLTQVDSPKILHGSRMSSKISEAVLSSGDDIAYCAFNTNGVPNSGGKFYDKTLVGDIEDLDAVCRWLKKHLTNLEKIILIGFSTGAFLAVCAPVMTETVSLCTRSLLAGVVSIACLEDPHRGGKLDFTAEQIRTFEETGESLTKFWPLVEVEAEENDGAIQNCAEINESPKPEPVEWPLKRDYYDSYLSLPGKEDITKLWPNRVPLVLVKGANHFFSAQKDMKKLQNAMKNFCADLTYHQFASSSSL